MFDTQHTLFKMRTTQGIFFVAITFVFTFLFLAQPILALATSASSWQIVPSPNRSTKSFSNNTLFGVAALSDSDVWAVGNFLSSNNGAINETLTEHWNGTAWKLVSSPNVGTLGSSLFAVSTASSKDVWAVGTVQTSSSVNGNRTLIEHWNGTAWSVVPSPNPSNEGDDLTGVAALSATNAWAVGFFENNQMSALQPIILHWNGTAWSLFPNIPNIGMIVEAITARSATDIWAVGSDAGETTNIALHFNGTQWSITSSANFPSSQQIISGVAAPAANDAWIVGSFAPPNVGAFLQPLALHWNGKTWSMVPTPNPSPFNNRLRAVAAISTSDVRAVGQANTPDGLNLVTLIEHWNGKQWSIVASPNVPDGSNTFDGLLGITVSGPTSLWSVGGFDSKTGERTLTLHNTQG